MFTPALSNRSFLALRRASGRGSSPGTPSTPPAGLRARCGITDNPIPASTFWPCGFPPKHPNRLNRDLGRKAWGDAGYAAEELVAEIGSAYACADLELSLEPREDHACY